jgi:hypothetical protein
LQPAAPEVVHCPHCTPLLELLTWLLNDGQLHCCVMRYCMGRSKAPRNIHVADKHLSTQTCTDEAKVPSWVPNH